MKALILLLCLFAATANAQQVLTPGENATKAVTGVNQPDASGFVAGAPIRSVRGKLYNFQVVNDWWLARTHGAKNDGVQGKEYYQFMPWIVFGHSLQMLEGGVLVERYGGNVFIRHFPAAVADGQFVGCVAKPDGLYQYTSTAGATLTVKAYDFGEVPASN